MSNSSVSRDVAHIERFNGTNFPQWKYGVFLLLEEHDLLSIVEGRETKPDEVKAGNIVTNAAEIKSWCKRDVRARNFIYSTTDNNQQRALANCKSSHEMWTRLSNQFLQNAPVSKHLVQQEFFEYKFQPDHKVMEHVTAIQTLASRLRDLGEQISDTQIVTKIICTLPPSFRNVVSAWDSIPEADQTLVALTARLLKEETLNNRYADETTTKSNQAFFARNFPNRSKQSSVPQEVNSHKQSFREKGSKRERPYCTNCKRFWHTIENCRKLKKQNNDEHAKKVKTEKKDDDPPDPSSSSTSVPAFCFISISCLKACQPNEWYLDSGATRHMSDQKWMLTNFVDIPPGNWVVNGIGDAKIEATGHGDAQVTITVNEESYPAVINNVLHVPGLGVNLISIGCLADRGFAVNFNHDSVTVSYQGIVKMTGQKMGQSLYRLNISPRGASTAQVASKAKPTADIVTWHNRLAHVNYETILKMIKKEAVRGIKLLPNAKIPTTLCSGCALGKMHRQPFQHGRERGTRVGDLVHSDICGPIEPPTPRGVRYFITFKDDFSGYTTVYFLKQKSEALDYYKVFEGTILAEAEAKVRTLRSDNAGENMSNEFTNYLTAKGVRHETSIAHTPQQNGVAERENRTLCEGARSVIHAQGLSKELWAEAINYAVYTLNRVLTTSSAGIIWDATPYELWFGKKPDISHLRTFGTKAFAHIPDVKRKKMDAKSQECILVGYCSTQKGYRLWNPKTRTMVISRDVIFCEEPNYLVRQLPLPNSDIDQSHAINVGEKHQATSPPTTVEPDTQQLPRRSTRGRIPIREWPALPAPHQHYTEPRTYKEALLSPDSDKWKASINDEYQSLMENGTWMLVERPPWPTTVLGCKWTFKLKPAVKNADPRRKTRLVAKGYEQKEGIDYNETYAPVVRYESLRAVLAAAASRDLEILQLDVKTAFLNGDLQETIYMEQPEGYITAGHERDVCLLKKTIYGLKQSSRAWNLKFNGFITQYGLQRSDADPCVYYRKTTDDFIIMAIWVDDGLICGSSTSIVNKMVEHLQSGFQATARPLDHFVGLIMQRDRLNRRIYISQPAYISKVISAYNMVNCRKRKIPADPGNRLFKRIKSASDESERETTPTFPYREAVGSLMYAASTFRPDIAFAVGQVSQHSNDPDKSHCDAVKSIIAYLAGTLQHGIQLGSRDKSDEQLVGFNGESAGQLSGFVDSDYAGDVNNFRSTTGYIFNFNGGPISWGSRQQKNVTVSTTEAEYVASSEAAREAVWLRRLVKSIGEEQTNPTLIRCDNQGAIKLTQSHEFRKKTKHIEVHHHYVREQVEKREITLSYIPTEDQAADIFTKPLPGPRFEKLRDMIGVVEVPQEMEM